MVTMSDVDAKPKKADKPAPVPSEDDRFRYIGFGIYPKKAPRFWKTTQEEAEFTRKVDLETPMSLFDRDFSLLHMIPISHVDKIIITLVSLVLIGTVAMPWVHFRTINGTDFGMSWMGALSALSGNLGTAFSGGIWVGITALLGLLIMIGAPVIGIWSLVALWTKAKSEDAFFTRLRLPLSLGYVLFFACFLGFILAFAGGQIPGYERWGLIDPGESYGFMALVTVVSYGAYVAAALGLVAGVKSGDL